MHTDLQCASSAADFATMDDSGGGGVQEEYEAFKAKHKADDEARNAQAEKEYQQLMEQDAKEAAANAKKNVSLVASSSHGALQS